MPEDTSPAPGGTMPLVKRLVRAYLRPHGRTLAIAVFAMAVDAACNGALAWLLEPMVDQVFKGEGTQAVWTFAGAVMAVFLIRGTVGYLHQVLMNRVGQRIVANVQIQLYGHLMRSDLAYFHATSSGQLISRLVNDVMVMRTAVAECITGIGKSALSLIFLIGVMFYQDWLLAIIAFTAFPLAAVALARIGRRLRRVAARTQAELGSFATLLNQTFQGIRHVKAYGMEASEERRVAGLTENLFRLANKGVHVSAMLTPINEIVSGIAIATVIVYGGMQIAGGESTAGQLISFIGAFLFAYDPMKKLSKLNAQLQIGLASAERVFEVLDTPPTILDRPGAIPLQGVAPGVELEGVDFSYQDGKAALHALSIRIPAGRTVALVGASGAGKSTVLNLIPRFYDVDGGAVRVGGHDVRDVTLSSLRAHIAIVSQETALFDDTVRANIAYGRPGASDEEIERAARDAAAHDFISALPRGYDTRVGEQGVKLSGGQRQRIAIARAMLKNAPILLLDEATSALDSESERAVQEALRRLQKGRTTLVIAHRLSTIMEADQIYVLDQGRVVETGTHGELIARRGSYARYHALQLGGETEDRPATATG